MALALGNKINILPPLDTDLVHSLHVYIPILHVQIATTCELSFVVSCVECEVGRTLAGWVSHVEVAHPHPASLSSTVGSLHVTVDLHH